MKMFIVILSLAISLWTVLVSPSFAGTGNALVKSRVVDVDGKQVEGAFIFFYDSPDTKRAVDLVSPPTDRKGECEKAVPPGTYWVLARLKVDADFDMGPLMIGDKVSSDPLEVEVPRTGKMDLDFTIMDLLDTIRLSSKKRNDLNRITGRILDSSGEPSNKAFAFASRHEQETLVPGYFSAWTDAEGNFTIYLPNGNFYLGTTTTFGPGQKYKAETALKVEGDKDNVELLVNIVDDVKKVE